MEPRSRTPDADNPFETELDTGLAVRNDGSLATPIEKLASVEAALSKVREMSPEELAQLIGAMSR